MWGIFHICFHMFCKKGKTQDVNLWVNNWNACQLPPMAPFSFPWNRVKQNIRGFSVSVYSKRFQKIKQSVHIPLRKTSSISSHGRLSNWNEDSDDKSICVSVCERQLGMTVTGSQTCSQMHNMSNPLVCICANWCIN